MDPILTAGSGWAGAGLLGLVVWWLLCRHLPALLEHHEKHAAQLRDDFKSALTHVLGHCDRESERLGVRLTDLADKLDRLASAITDRRTP